MNRIHVHVRFSLLLWLAFFVSPLQANAQADFPLRPITIVVTVNPGGVTDVVARTVAKQLSEALGQSVLVENRTGATHAIGANYVRRAAPDGYTLLAVEGAGLMVDFSGHLPYDPTKDFTAVSGLVRAYHTLVANPAFPAKDVKELIDIAKRSPGTINFGTFGVGSSGHVNVEMLNKLAGIKLVPVHYRGAAPAMNDVIGGHIPLMFLNLASALSQARAGSLKILAVGSRTRLPSAQDYPTFIDSGVADYAPDSWFGLFGPPGMPAALTTRLNQEVQTILNDPKLQTSFLQPSLYQAMVGSPQDFSALVNSEEKKWDSLSETLKAASK